LRHTSNSALVVVLGEDLAALLGLLLASLFLSIAALTGNPIYDAIGSMCIGLVLLVISVFLSLRVRSLLVGRSADPIVLEVIDTVIAADPDIQLVFNLITIQLGPDTMLAAKIKLRSGISLEEAVATINRLEKRLKEKVPGLKWSFVEPDIED